MLDMNTMETKNIMDVLFNEKNNEPVELVDAKGRTLKLQQVFAMTMDDGKAYCILAPINKVEGLEAGVGLVFKVENESLKLENEREAIAKVFRCYYDILRQSVALSRATEIA